MKLETIPEAIRIDAAKAIATKGIKKLPEGWAKAGKKTDPKKIETTLHYLNVSITIHEDGAAVESRARCRKLLGIRETAKGNPGLAAIPELIRMDIGSMLTMRGMSKLPTDWVSEEYGVPPDKLQAAVHYLDIAKAIHRNLTTMNWRAQCLRLLHRWDDAIAAFREIIDFATGDRRPIYVPSSRKSIRLCEKRRAKAPAPAKPKKATPVSDPEYAKVAASFAEALVAGDFKKARTLMSRSLQKSTSEKSLAKSVKSLLPSAKSKIDDSNVVETMDDWSDKRPGDAGWAYVALTGEDFSEGAAVTVSKEGSRLFVRQVEWGRP